jgi:hypothetical protein
LKPCIDAGNVIRLLRVPRPRRIEVQISARDGRLPIGRTRALRIRECDLPALIEAAERLEARG